MKDVVLAHRSFAGYDPSFLVNQHVAVDGTLYSSADARSPFDSNRSGFELWRSDGTTAGTVLIKDIREGTASGSPRQLTNFNGTVLFIANDGVSGDELWRTDGSAAGTVLVKDINTGSGGSVPFFASLVNANGTLFFTAQNSATGMELWRSDGTAAGTYVVKDIKLGPASSYPMSLANVDGTLFFSAEGNGKGRELWRSDGTAAGTRLVKDIFPSGLKASNPSDFTSVNGKLYFTADDGMHGRELWRSDGTDAGTVLVKDVAPGAASGGLTALTNFNGRLMFQANDGVNGNQLWQSDGTSSGTRSIAGIAQAAIAGGPSLAVVGNKLFFVSRFNNGGAELFKYGPRADVHTIYQSDSFSGKLSGFDADGDSLAFKITANPSHGQLTSFNTNTGAYTYQPDPDYSGADSFAYLVSDGTTDSNQATVKITIKPNHAPVLDRSVAASLVGIKEDGTNSSGTPATKLLAGVTDADAGAKYGLAISYVTNTTDGVWQFTLNGGKTWTNVGTVSKSAALLIPALGTSSRIRFVPIADFNGIVKVGFYAWDQTRGTAGGTFNIAEAAARGGATAFSTSYRASSLAIAPVNDAPVLSLGGTIGYVHDYPAITLAPSAAVSDIDSVNFNFGRLVVQIAAGASSSNRLSIGGGFSVDSDDNVLQGTKIIGKRTSSGVGTHNLVVVFNWRVTPTVARDLVRAISFKTVGGDAGERVVTFTLSDGDGGTSGIRKRSVKVV